MRWPVWPGTPRPLDELLPSSVLIEVESLSEMRMQIHAVEEEIDLRNNFEEGDFGEEEGDFGVVEFDPFLYQFFPPCFGA